MANTRSSEKRARQNQKKQERNQRLRSATKTSVREAVQVLKKGGTSASLQEALVKASRALDQAASRGVIPKKRASRKISRLAQLTQKMQGTATPAS